MKIIKVAVCSRCPYLVLGSPDFCKLNHYKKVTNPNIQLDVPKWCPLEDYKEADHETKANRS